LKFPCLFFFLFCYLLNGHLVFFLHLIFALLKNLFSHLFVYW
jgi:hypothetical protein